VQNILGMNFKARLDRWQKTTSLVTESEKLYF